MKSSYFLAAAVVLAALVAAHVAASQTREKRALATPIDGPMALAIDNAGHLFTAAVDENKVYRIDLARGTIAAVAGNGKECCYKDGLKATAVSFDVIRALAVDSQGNLFISEGAQVHKVDVVTGRITTVADAGKLTEPHTNLPAAPPGIYGLALNSAGDLFIADTYLSQIFRLDSKTGNLLRVAGSGKQGFDGDGGLATDASFRFVGSIALDHAGNLLIADQENCRIRRVDHATGVINSIAVTSGPEENCPPTHAFVGPLPTPDDLAVDASGNVYFIEPAMNIVMMLDPNSGAVSTVAGTGGLGFSGDGGPATKAEISGPSGLAIDANGNLFVSDYRNKRVRRVDSRTKQITSIAGNGLPRTIHAEM